MRPWGLSYDRNFLGGNYKIKVETFLLWISEGGNTPMGQEGGGNVVKCKVYTVVYIVQQTVYKSKNVTSIISNQQKKCMQPLINTSCQFLFLLQNQTGLLHLCHNVSLKCFYFSLNVPPFTSVYLQRWSKMTTPSKFTKLVQQFTQGLLAMLVTFRMSIIKWIV